MFAISPTALFLPSLCAPSIPSPLAPRCANARLATRSSKMDPSHPDTFSSTHSTPASRPTHQRQSKYARLNRGASKERERRRGTFLDKVREKGEEKRFEARGEQALRLDWLAQQRAWEEDQRARASEWEAAIGEEGADGLLEEVDIQGSQMDHGMDHVFDEFEEVDDQVLEDMAAEAKVGAHGSQDQDLTDYGSEDEDYDTLLTEIAIQAEAESAGGELTSSTKQEDQDMDMS